MNKLFLLCFFIFVSTASLNAKTQNDSINTDPTNFSAGQQLTQALFAGATAGAAAHPFHALQVDSQSHKPVNLKPSHLFHGLPVTIARFAPVTSVLLLTNKATGGDKDDISFQHKVGAATVAGIAGGIANHPFEYTFIKQRQSPVKLKANVVAKEIMKHRGTLGVYHGIGHTLLREVAYTWGMLIVPNKIKGMVMKKDEKSKVKEYAAATLAGVLTGVATAPLDVAAAIKMREKLTENKIKNSFSILQETYKTGGLKETFKAANWRAARLAVLFPVLYMAKDAIGGVYTRSNQKRIDRRLAEAKNK